MKGKIALDEHIESPPISENDRLKIGRTNSQKHFKLQPGVSSVVQRAA